MSEQARTVVRVLVAGLGNMGISHAKAYQANPGFEIASLVNRSKVTLPQELADRQIEPDYYNSLHKHKPDLVSVNTYSDTHAEYAIAAMEAGAIVA